MVMIRELQIIFLLRVDLKQKEFKFLKMILMEKFLMK